MTRVLAVDDDKVILDTLRLGLQEEGYSVEVCTSGEEGISKAQSAQYDFIILDVGLPGMDGFEAAERIRANGITTPIIMLTAHSSEEDTVRGFQSGADDYVTKPFSGAELLARLRAMARRASSSMSTIRQHGDLEMDLQTRIVRRGNQQAHLTDKEFSLLWALAERPLSVWSREALLKQVWGIDFDPKTKVLDVHLSYLRKKLASIDSSPIQTLHGKGWRLKG